MCFYRFLSRLTFGLALGGMCSFAQTMAIVNGASFNPRGPMAPGSFASMFGENLCSQTVAGDWIAPGQLPTELGGCSVTVNGLPAMIHYTSRRQVNFIVPDGLGIGTAHVVMRNGSNSVQGTMMVGSGGPGVFAMNGMGIGRGAVLHSTLWRNGPFSVTTDGQPTYVSIYMTGLDLRMEPAIHVGGVPVEVTWYGNAPGFAGLQQVNVKLPAHMAGVGMVPMTVTSGGEKSNVTYMNILPTTEMMQGMPGWNSGRMVGENMGRVREMSDLAYIVSNHNGLVSDEGDDALRVISMDSFETLRTITLPDGSEASAVAVNAEGSMAAAALSHNASVALINLQRTGDISIIGTGFYPSHVAFTGARLLVTNAGSGTVTVIDTVTRSVTRTIDVGIGPSGIAADSTRAIVSNMQAGSLSVVNLLDYSVASVDLPPGTRPHKVAIDSRLNKAVITTPMSNGFLILNLATNQFTHVKTDTWNAMGPGAVAIHNSRAYIANQMTASVTVVDLNTDSVLNTFPVAPGPRALSVDPSQNRLMVLSHGTGILSAIDLSSFAVIGRANATDSNRDSRWTLPVVTLLTPSSAPRGASFEMTIAGVNFQDVDEVEFYIAGVGTGPSGGMGTGSMTSGTNDGTPGSGMGSGGMGGGMMTHDENIRTPNLQVSADGTQITLSVTVLANAAIGTRRISLGTSHGEVMGGPMFNGWFTVTP